tara:strand:+ start:7144 stop:9231 length:2088 start_codon:yes stop_codon:yes gene_type:complete
MIEQSVVKSNFVGRDGFRWWLGQVAPEDAQSDQLNMTGWGNRVKVRIMGYHPTSVEELPNSDLPWAQVLLGSCDGSGKANRATSLKLSPGDDVVGFFLDGDDAQLPVVMGVFGTTLDQDELIKTLGGEYKSPFVPFTGYTSKIKNDGAYIVNRESNEMNTKSQVSPQHVPQSLLSSLPEDARSAYNGIGDTIVAANTSRGSTVNKISGEVGNMVSKLQSMKSKAGGISNISGKISKVIGGVTSKIKGLSKGVVNFMTNNLYKGGVLPVLKKGVDILYKTVYGQVLAATKKTDKAKKAGAAAQKAMIGPVKLIQDALPCIASKIMDTIGSAIKSLLTSIASNVSNFVSCIGEQFVGGLFNHIIGGITNFLNPLMGGVGTLLKFAGGFDIGGFLRSKAAGLQGILDIVSCSSTEPTVNSKTNEWTIGKGPKNILGVSIDKIVEVANAADKITEGVIGGIQGISVASGSLGMFDFLNPSVTNPGFKSGLGECYAGPPLNCAGIKINIFGGGGTQALGKAIIGSIVGDGAEAVGSLIGIDLVSGGSGYTTPPYVEITDNCNKGIGAVARAVIDYDEDSPTYQQVTDIYIVSDGEGYPVSEEPVPHTIDHVVVVNPGLDYSDDDTITDDDGNIYDKYLDEFGRILKIISPNSALTNSSEINDLPELTIKSNTGYGAILKPQLKPRPTYQGEVKQVIDCIT